MKNITYTLLIIFFLINNSLNAQNIKLKSRNIDTKENLLEFIDKTNHNEDVVFGKYYKYITFKAIPTKERQDELREIGVTLLDYIPNKTYIAELKKSTNKSELINFNIKSINDIKDIDRISLNASTLPYPAYATEGNNVLLNIELFKNVSIAKVRENLVENNIEIVEKEFYKDYSSYLVVKMPQGKVKDLLQFRFIQYIDLVAPTGEPEDELAGNMHRNTLINTQGAGRKYNGEGVSVAVNDDGVVGPHIDFKGRMVDLTGGRDVGNHGDMVAGIVGGAGNVNPINFGMATGSKLYIRNYDGTLPNTVSLFQDSGILIFQSSYSNGCNAGYTSTTRKVDQEITANPKLIQIFSAGNSNNQNCGYGAGNQWGNITGGHKIGKNVMAVANLQRDGSITNSSSRGPAEDGRIKPDISSNGTDHISTDPNNTYALGGGTSAAAPGISGIFAQMHQAHQILNSGDTAESALIKCILMNTADDIGNTGPDFIFGWGRVNAYKAVLNLENNQYFSGNVNQGQTNTHSISIPNGIHEIKVMVYWSDPEATITATTALINDIDIVLKNATNSITYQPWLLDHSPNVASLSSPATKGRDSVNNVEQVSVLNPAAGNYTLEVTGSTIPFGNHKYWVSYEFIRDELKLVNPNGGEGYIPGETVRLFWNAVGTNGTFTLEYSTDNGTTWQNIASNISASRDYFDWQIPNVATSQALVRLSRGSQMDISDNNFTIISTPQNITIEEVCADSIHIKWDVVANADMYEVYLLGDKYMDSMGQTNQLRFAMPIDDFREEQWVSVAAIKQNNQNLKGKRAIAVNHMGGRFNCNLNNDLEAIRIINPVSGCNYTNNVEVEIRNIGLTAASNFTIFYQLDNNPAVSQVYTQSISPLNSVMISFPNNITATGNSVLKIWIDYPVDQFNLNDTLELIFNEVMGFPLEESFETYADCDNTIACRDATCQLGNDWRNLINNSEDDTDWRVNQGSTPSPNTGPITTNPGNGSKYIYLEATNCFSNEGILESTCVDLNNRINPEISFWYHMNGNSTMGDLFLDIFHNGSWTNIFQRRGDQGSSWIQENISLQPYLNSIVQFRFRGVTGTGFRSDIALDNINISGEASSIDEITDKLFSIYPNPANNKIFIESINSSTYQNLKIRIYNNLGKLILEQNLINQSKNEIDVSTLNNGLYHIDINDGLSSLSKQKLVISK